MAAPLPNVARAPRPCGSAARGPGARGTCRAIVIVALLAMFNATEARGAFEERVEELRIEPGVRAVIVKPAKDRWDATRPAVLVLYATPNGSTIEQTLGARVGPGGDRRFDLQHVAAQVRRWREVDPSRNVVLAIVEAQGLSWPAWRQKQGERAALLIPMLLERLRREAGPEAAVILTGHSGGGSLTFGLLDAVEAVPPWVERIALLDSNYAYADERKHGDKLIAWLTADGRRRLVVIAYDDREVTLDGKKVVGPTGGTWRASGRMLARFAREGPVAEGTAGAFLTRDALGGRARFFLHPNAENRILHTALVGEMNGLLHALTIDTPAAGKWGALGGPRAYGAWVAEAPKAGATRPAGAPATRPAATGAGGVPERLRRGSGGR